MASAMICDVCSLVRISQRLTRFNLDRNKMNREHNRKKRTKHFTSFSNRINYPVESIQEKKFHTFWNGSRELEFFLYAHKSLYYLCQIDFFSLITCNAKYVKGVFLKKQFFVIQFYLLCELIFNHLNKKIHWIQNVLKKHKHISRYFSSKVENIELKTPFISTVIFYWLSILSTCNDILLSHFPSIAFVVLYANLSAFLWL